MKGGIVHGMVKEDRPEEEPSWQVPNDGRTISVVFQA